MLHLISQSPYRSSSLPNCLRTLRSGDVLLFINEGVYGGQEGSPQAPQIRALAQAGCHFYALTGDLDERGIADQLLSCVQPVGFGGFVDLTEQHRHCQSWY